MTPKLHHDAKPASTEAPAGSSDDTLPVGGAEALPLVGADAVAVLVEQLRKHDLVLSPIVGSVTTDYWPGVIP
jgi:hypothetical protein